MSKLLNDHEPEQPTADFPELHTDRLRLRMGQNEDAASMLTLYGSEEVVQYLPLSSFTTLEEALDELGWHRSIFEKQTGIRWLMEDRRTGRVIGTCGYLEWDHTHRRAELGYDLLSDYWGDGWMTEALECILRYGWESMQLHRIEAKVDPANLASGRLLSRLGFSLEGVLRDYEYEKGTFINLAVYSRIRNE
ncbi:GNAT family protein [Paenibacillus sp. JX-17]|uniref:GNAT family protein n=2 Tax=Paenibacillus lacisoli TaxID=3064525 RepID=A0ABT9CKY4_9BACL|nr:GNAT family protein [Paenibacillus sp. JX-17]MDO7908293.1 GNAT family protein [Paenibacillus sp. JX-17]